LIADKESKTMPTLYRRTATGFVPDSLRAREGQGGGVFAAATTDLQIVPFRDGGRDQHALIGPPRCRIRVNGALVVGGVHVLDHKDELVIGAEQIFFSAESTPVVEIYQHGNDAARRPRCPVCRAAIEEGDSIVRCPGCSRIHHQIPARGGRPEKPCWTYSPQCRFCEHPTSLSGQPGWQPDEHEF
jgi:hypothetical protein